MTNNCTRANIIEAELRRVDHCVPCPHDPEPKHVKMASSPYHFFRGSAQLFYRDLNKGIMESPPILWTAPRTAIMGDCHLSNFGLLTEEGSHSQQLVFSPNDFDDACFGHAGWDILRFLVSLFLADDWVRGLDGGQYASTSGTGLQHLKPLPSGQINNAGKAFIGQYQATCQAIADRPSLRMDAFDSCADNHILFPSFQKAQQRIRGGKKFSTKSALARLLAPRGKDEGIMLNKDGTTLSAIDDATQQDILNTFRPYVDDTIVDVAKRERAGTGSINMTRYYLLVGPGKQCNDLALFHIVELKQQRVASPLLHFPDIAVNNQLDPAHLTVECQRLMQRQADLILDDVYWRDQHWLIRSRHHARVGMDPEMIASVNHYYPMAAAQYARACAHVLALAHSRGDRRSVLFESAMASILDTIAPNLLPAAEQYAQQVINDYEQLNTLLGIEL